MYKTKVENLKQLDIVLSSKNVSEIILARDSFSENVLPKLVDKIKKNNKTAWILLERISRYEESMKSVEGNDNYKFRGNDIGVMHHELLDLRTSTDEIFKIKNLGGIIIQNLDSFAYMLRKINKASNENLIVELNYTMNCYNSETKMLYEKMYNEKRNNASDVPLRFTAPVELNIYELDEVGYDTMIIYSYIDTMVTANCLRKNIVGVNVDHIVLGNDVVAKYREQKTIGAKHREPNVGSKYCEPICKNRFRFNNVQDFSSYIIDRKGKKLYYKTYCKYCYNKIFNTEPLFLFDKIEEIQKLDIIKSDADVAHIVLGDGALAKNSSTRMGKLCEPTFRIDFSFENEQQVKDILSMKCPESFTRGHYKTSIK